MKKQIRCFVEKLHHFSCNRCNSWWSIADYETAKKGKKLRCPHCGLKRKPEKYQ